MRLAHPARLVVLQLSLGHHSINDHPIQQGSVKQPAQAQVDAALARGVAVA